MEDLARGLGIVKEAAARIEKRCENIKEEYEVSLAALEKIAAMEEEDATVVIAKNAIYDILELRKG